MKTVAGREIKATPNYSNRTFTIRCKGEVPIKYRTIPMTLHEFEDNLHNTANDWNWFLRNTDDYYKV